MNVRRKALLVIFVLLLVLGGVVCFFTFRPDSEVTTGSPEVFTLQTADAKGVEAKEKYDLSSIVILTRVISYIRNYYYDPARIEPEKMFQSALEEVARKIPSVMVDFEETTRLVKVKIGGQEKVFEYGNLDNIWKIQYLIADIFRFIQPGLEPQIDPKDVEYAAINGMLDTLDPHSVHLPPKIYRELKLNTTGNFGGLGIQIGIRDGNLTIIAPIMGTPAWRAGLKAKDAIEKIDGQSTINMSLDEAVQLMRGEKGTSCKLTIMRKGFSEAEDFDIVRDIIKIQSVNAKLMPGQIGYVQVKNFQGNTVSDLKKELAEMTRKGPLFGLILDLRGNPGGLLEAAVKMADLFLDTGVIVTTVGANNEQLEVNEATLVGGEEKYPMVVLVGSSSASASEIVAGALKNNNRAVIVGDRTFGKGSVQMIYDMEDKSALKLTVAQYLTPGEVSIQSVGIVPDIELLPVYIEKDLIDFYSSEKMNRERDLEHHLEHASTVEDKPFELLRYLWDEKRDEIDIDAPPETVNVNDFTIQLAHKILREVGNISRREIILQRSVKLLKKQDKQEDVKIVKRFKDFDVDWEDYGQNGAGRMETTASYDATPPFIAGQTVHVNLTIKNTGAERLARLRAITDSDNPTLDGLEFFFGSVMPGQSKSWKTKVEIPKGIESREDEVVFRVFDASQSPFDPHIERVSMRGLARPDFAYTFQAVDASGNGDDLVQKGETIRLLLNLENVGQGPVVEGLATLKNSDNLKDIFITTGRAKFDPINPGEKREVAFTFNVLPELQENEFTMELAIMDTELREYATDPVKFTIAEPLPLSPAPAGQTIAPPERTPIYGSPEATLPVVAWAAAGAPLPVLAASGPWVKVSLAAGRHGWVRNTTAWPLAAGTVQTETAIVETRRSPVIEVANAETILFTDEKHVPVEGVASDDNALKDIYILCNNKKIYYLAAKDGKDPLRLPFSAEIELDEGANRITIIARESETFASRKNLYVYRKKSSHEPKPQIAGEFGE